MKTNLLSIILLSCLFFSCKNNTSLPEVTQVPFKVSDSDKYGMMNVDGSILFEDEFDQLPSIAVNGIFTVKNKQEKLEYFKADKKPKQITETSYIDGGYYTEGVIPVVKPERPISFIDKNGKELFVLGTFEGKRIQWVNAYFSDGLMMFVTEEGKRGYINSKGQVVIKPIFDIAFPFNEKVAIVGEKVSGEEYVKFSIIDCSGKKIGDLKSLKEASSWNNMYSDEIFTSGNKAFNKKGELIFRSPSKWKILLSYNEGYTMFQDDNDECGITNKKGEVVIRAKYNRGTRNIGNYFVGVDYSDSKYSLSFLDDNENRVEKLEDIENFSLFTANKCIVQEENEYYFIDESGKALDKNNYSFIYTPSLESSFWYANSLFLAYIQKENLSSMKMVKSDYCPSQEAISSVLNVLNTRGVGNIQMGMSLQAAMKYYNMGDSDKHSYDYWDNFEGIEGIGNLKKNYRIQFNDYISDYSGYNYNTTIRHIIINIDRSEVTCSNAEKRLYDAAINYLKNIGFTKTGHTDDWMDEEWDIYSNDKYSYYIAVNKDASKLCLESK